MLAARVCRGACIGRPVWMCESGDTAADELVDELLLVVVLVVEEVLVEYGEGEGEGVMFVPNV